LKDSASISSRRATGADFCRPCWDWTERRPHLGGTVGAVLAQRCFDLKWLQHMRGSRALIITPGGRRGLSEAFGLSL
jgi:hypothetical protein